MTIPSSGKVLISVRTADQPGVTGIAEYLAGHGFQLVATEGTARSLRSAGLTLSVVNKVTEGSPHVLEGIQNNEYDLIINTTASRPNSHQDAQTIRRAALMKGIPYFTTLSAARAACEAHAISKDPITVHRLQALHCLVGGSGADAAVAPQK